MANGESWIDGLKDHFDVLFGDLYSWFKYTLFMQHIKAADYWASVIYRLKLIGLHIWNGLLGAVQDAKDWASAFITNIFNTLVSVWDSIKDIWKRFGAAILEGTWTVVKWVSVWVDNIMEWAKQRYDAAKSAAIEAWDWVSVKGGNVWDWIVETGTDVWWWIRDKGGKVWDWIRDKGGNVWDWIVKTGAAIESWWNKHYLFYSELFDKYRNQLWSFLEDPERFILDYVVDGIEYVISWGVTRFW